MSEWMPRSDDLVTELVDDALVVYDNRTDQVHYVTDDTLAVLEALPGSVDTVSAMTGLAEDDVNAHLHGLLDRDLIEARSAEEAAASRRALLKSAAMASISLGIWSMTAPTPAAASSTSPGTGSSPNWFVVTTPESYAIADTSADRFVSWIAEYDASGPRPWPLHMMAFYIDTAGYAGPRLRN